MKLTIEIPDSALRAAVEAEVGRAIAKVSEDVIQAKLDTVLAAKLGHIQKQIPAQVGVALRAAINDCVNGIIGVTTRERQVYIRAIVADIVTETLKNVR